MKPIDPPALPTSQRYFYRGLPKITAVKDFYMKQVIHQKMNCNVNYKIYSVKLKFGFSFSEKKKKNSYVIVTLDFNHANTLEDLSFLFLLNKYFY